MNDAFPRAKIESYQHLITTISLPDPDDRHVVAAALRGSVDAIVTFNTKDFPRNLLKSEYQMLILDPDNFILKLAEINIELTQKAFLGQLKSLKKPPISKDRLIEILRKCGLKESLKLFDDLIPEDS